MWVDFGLELLEILAWPVTVLIIGLYLKKLWNEAGG